MVSSAHRFLHRQDPDSPALPRHTILQGHGVSDIVFHDMFHGCVPVGRSLELWAMQEWGEDADAPVVVVRLTHLGELDYAGNADPAEAQQLFENAGRTRAPRYGQRRAGSRLSDEPAAETSAGDGGPAVDQDAAEGNRAAGARAATAVGDGIGAGQGLVNRMDMIASALDARSETRFLVVVDDLGAQLESLLATGQNAVHDNAVRVLRRRWLNVRNQTGALVMYLDADRRLSRLIGPDTPGVGWWEVGEPKTPEIAEALRRIDARTPLGLDPDHSTTRGVVSALERYQDLRSALGNVARALKQHGRVTLEGVLDLPPVDLEAADRILAELDALVGLDELKNSVRAMVKSARERRQRLERDGIVSDETLHLVFVGNPGTGKTTVARIIARLFHALGAIPSDSFSEVSAKDVKSEFRGETRTNMQRTIQSALGGVLFLDEAQQFAVANDTAAVEAIEALVPMAWNHRHELVVIAAGYAAGMTDLMAMDIGLPRRFPRSRWFEFHDYNDEELWTVLERDVRRRGLQLDDAVRAPLRRLLASRSSRSGFGNAGGVGNLVSEVQGIHDARDDAPENLLTVDDLPAKVTRRPAEYAEAMAALDRLTGLARVKRAVAALRAELEFAELEDDDLPGAPRFRFVGPPGTGKTTVARLIGQLLYGMGLLDRKTCVEVTGAALKAGYVGQTTDLVRRKFDEARGGVLFIDEAHSLMPTDSFAQDALSTLVSELTHPDNRDTVVIFAGYPEEIARLLDSDPGLTRRFGTELVFDNLTPDECVEVARSTLARGPAPFTAEPEFFVALAENARRAMLRPGFGNAGWVDNQVAAAKQSLKLRVMADRDSFDAEGRRHLIAADLDGDVAGASSTHDPDDGHRPLDLDSTFAPTDPVLPAPAGPVDRATGVPRVRDSVVHLRVTNGSGRGVGTGFVVAGHDLIVTNRHMIEDASAIEVRSATLGLASGRVVAIHESVDLALVALTRDDDATPLVPLPLGDSRVLDEPEELVVVGNAQVQAGERPRVVLARVGRNLVDDDDYFETDGAIEEGFSGGPLWHDGQGAVVGVVVGGRGKNVKVAIRAEKVLELLESLGYTSEETRT